MHPFLSLAPIACLLLLAGCRNATLLTDAEFQALRSNPRPGERFHYVGSEGEYDYFVGEQWSWNSIPAAARQTEHCYKIKLSSIVSQHMPLTDDVTQWVLIDEKR